MDRTVFPIDDGTQPSGHVSQYHDTLIVHSESRDFSPSGSKDQALRCTGHLRYPSSTPKKVKHSSELHNISDISDEGVEEDASTNDPVTEFWGTMSADSSGDENDPLEELVQSLAQEDKAVSDLDCKY